MDKWNDEQDRELAAVLKQLADDNRLIDYLADLLALADSPEFEMEGAVVSLKAPAPTISDKSCYKKCLKEDIRNPGSYKECIRKCRKKTKLALEVFAFNRE